MVNAHRFDAPTADVTRITSTASAFDLNSGFSVAEQDASEGALLVCSLLVVLVVVRHALLCALQADALATLVQVGVRRKLGQRLQFAAADAPAVIYLFSILDDWRTERGVAVAAKSVMMAPAQAVGVDRVGAASLEEARLPLDALDHATSGRIAVIFQGAAVVVLAKTDPFAAGGVGARVRIGHLT